MTTVNRVLRGLAGLVALAAIVAGIPAAMLTVLDGDPRRLLPEEAWPSLTELPEWVWHRLRWAWDTGEIAVYVLIAAGWMAWLGLTWMITVEVFAQIRHGAIAARGRLSTIPPRRWIAGLVSSVILLGSTTPAAATPTPGADVVATAPRHPPSPDLGTLGGGATVGAASEATVGGVRVAEPTSYTARCPRVHVVLGDTLWGLAERHLGDGHRYTEIVNLNRDRLAPGGPNHLEIGWELLLPPDATRLPEPATRPCADDRTVTVRDGDTLIAIALRELDAPEQWRAIFDANHRRPQADGRALIDPDVILPGWTLTIPASTAGATRPAEPGQHDGTPEPDTTQRGHPNEGEAGAQPSAPPPTVAESPSPTTSTTGTPPSRDAPDPAADRDLPTADADVTLPSGSVVAFSLAISVLTLLALARRRARARRRLGGDSSVSPAPVPDRTPAVAVLARAAHRHSTAPPARSVEDEPAEGPRRVWPPLPVELTARTLDGTRRRLRLADVAGIGLAGPGAAAAIRAVLAAVATADTLHPGQCWISDPATLARLGGDDYNPDLHVGTDAADRLPGATCARDPSDALARLETEIARRTRLLADHELRVVLDTASADQPRLEPRWPDRAAEFMACQRADPAQDLPQIVACAQPTSDSAARWAAVAELGRNLGIHILLLTTDWNDHLEVTADGTITASRGPHAAALTDCRVDTLNANEADDIAQLVATTRAEPPRSPPTQPEPSDTPAARTPKDAASDADVTVRVVSRAMSIDTNPEGIEVTGMRAGAREALAYLACHQREASSDAMAEHLFGDLQPDKQRAALHSAISHARRSLRDATGTDADFILSSNGRYRIDHHHVHVDAWSLDADLSAAKTTSDPVVKRQALLGVLDTASHGPPESLARFDWADDLVESWRAQVTHALAALADTLTEDHPDRAAEALRAAITWDPYAEDLYRRTITLHLHRGDTADAHHTYRRLRTRLAELDLEPSPDIADLLPSRTKTRQNK